MQTRPTDSNQKKDNSSKTEKTTALQIFPFSYKPTKADLEQMKTVMNTMQQINFNPVFTMQTQLISSNQKKNNSKMTTFPYGYKPTKADLERTKATIESMKQLNVNPIFNKEFFELHKKNATTTFMVMNQIQGNMYQTHVEAKTVVNNPQENEPSTVRLFFREVGKIVTIGGIVSAAMLPLDLVLNWAHTSNSKKQPGPRFSFGGMKNLMGSAVKGLQAGVIFATGFQLLKIYSKAFQGASVKNATLSQRSNVDSKLCGPKPEKEFGMQEKEVGLTEEMEQPSQKAPLQGAPTWVQVGAVSLFIGMADTTITQKPSNERFWLSYKLINPAFQGPNKATNFAAWFNLAKAGYGIRLMRNGATVGGLIAVPLVAETISTNLPDNQYKSVIANYTATALIAGPIGIISNAFDFWYKQTLTTMNSSTQKTDPSFQVARKIFAEKGAKVFLNGYGIATLYTTLAYVVVPKSETFAEKTVVPTVEKQIDHYLPKITAFFGALFSNSESKQPQSSVIIEEVSDQKNDKDQSKQSSKEETIERKSNRK